ncbi:phage tail assembly chaperone [Pseudomonas sp. EMN2]|uniref:phage tail assembly chaperone n=1 Tax=Pseudomonas sp. EMN2 TaxID=2615212 RepID=UPI0021139817|nr:phage tail assembly chaperone [Pseudomonas sp. EMN2]
MLLAIIEMPESESADAEYAGPEDGEGLLDLAQHPDVGALSWYHTAEQRFLGVRPSSAHVWNGQSWALDEVLGLEARATAERTWRDVELTNAVWLRDRHRDQVEIGGSTTLTAEQFQELLVYMQALRDWPQCEAFPDSAQRPVAPTWVAEQTL